MVANWYGWDGFGYEYEVWISVCEKAMENIVSAQLEKRTQERVGEMLESTWTWT
jgi:hypothetical protein